MTAHHGALVAAVEPGGMAEAAGIAPGDRIISINGKILQDLIDIQYQCAGTSIRMVISQPAGEKRVVKLQKGCDEGLGISLASATFDGIRRCGNRCIFCFVEQLPPGMRDSLYVKDDDYRHSFLHGNFITLTNLRERDVARIKTLRLSPLYISVHATNPALRERMMRHPAAGGIMDQLRMLVEAGIRLHAQIVLCPGVNDGAELHRTITDLAGLWPGILSIAVVPVGLTKHRRDAEPLRGFTPADSKTVLQQLSGYQKEFLARLGTRLVFAADEFFITAGRRFPATQAYEDFPQIENGVGLVRQFLDGFTRVRQRLPHRRGATREIGVVTGVSAAQLLSGVIHELEQRMPGMQIRLMAIENHFFGPQVTVAGLLTGADLLRALEGVFARQTTVLLPGVMVRAEDDLLLDGWRVAELAQRLDLDLRVVPPTASALAAALLTAEPGKCT